MYHYKLPSKDDDHAVMERTEEKKAPSPIDSPMFAGSAYFIWKRDAVQFMLKGNFCCVSSPTLFHISYAVNSIERERRTVF